jgi:hypothetical protein
MVQKVSGRWAVREFHAVDHDAVLRHAQARQARLKTQKSPGSVTRITLKDHGDGFW